MKIQTLLALALFFANSDFIYAEPPAVQFEVVAKCQVAGQQYPPGALKLTMPEDTRGSLHFPTPKNQSDLVGLFIGVEPTMKDGRVTYKLDIAIADSKDPMVKGLKDPTVALESSGDTFLGAPVKYSFFWQEKKFDVEIVFSRFKE